MNTESFFGSGAEDVPEPETEKAMTKVTSLDKIRESKRYLEQQARRAEEQRKQAPDWTEQDQELLDAGWIPSVSGGYRLWQEAPGGFYKQTEFAHAHMKRRKESPREDPRR